MAKAIPSSAKKLTCNNCGCESILDICGHCENGGDCPSLKKVRRVWAMGTGINKAGDRYIGFTGEGKFECVARVDDVDEDLLQKLLEIANEFHS